MEMMTEIQIIKEELNNILIRTNFEERGHKNQYVVSKEDLIRLVIKFVKLIERINNDRS